MYRYRDILCCLELPESGFAQGNDWARADLDSRVFGVFHPEKLSSHSPRPPTTQGSFSESCFVGGGEAAVRTRIGLGKRADRTNFWAPKRKGSVSHCRDVAFAPPTKSWIPHAHLRRPPHPKQPVITAEHLFCTLTLRQMSVILIEDSHTLPPLRHHHVHPSRRQKDVPGSRLLSISAVICC